MELRMVIHDIDCSVIVYSFFAGDAGKYDDIPESGYPSSQNEMHFEIYDLCGRRLPDVEDRLTEDEVSEIEAEYITMASGTYP